MVSRRCEREAVLAVDIGASSIKFCHVGERGEHLEEVERVATPYPCTPSALITLVAKYVRASASARVGVGFPGAMLDGRVLEPGNLSRPGGFTSPIDPELHRAWISVDLEEELCRATRVRVRVVNDATLAALGCTVGEGRELVLTLGTGFGIALVVEGRSVAIRDVGAELCDEDETYDEALGDYACARDVERWNERLVRATARFVEEFAATLVHLGGGNSRRINVAAMSEVGAPVVVTDNDTTLSGAAKLFDGETVPSSQEV
jgi:polyphosphate glucokinase